MKKKVKKNAEHEMETMPAPSLNPFEAFGDFVTGEIFDVPTKTAPQGVVNNETEDEDEGSGSVSTQASGSVININLGNLFKRASKLGDSAPAPKKEGAPAGKQNEEGTE